MEKAIGIDLGGTSIYGGIINDSGEILKSIERETGKGVGATEVLRRITLVIEDLLEGESDISGIGIGSPGFINSNEGRVLAVGGNIEGWACTDIKGEMKKVFPMYQIFVGNDANLAGICEGWIGAGKNFKSFIMLTIGTGLGGAIYTYNHGIWHGHNYQGAELGHAILYPNGRDCTCGQKGCAEQYVSGSAIEMLYLELTGVSRNGKDIFDLYETDNAARDIINSFADNLAIYIASLKNIFDPEGIVIGGGVIYSRGYWWDRMINSYNKYVNNPSGISIVAATKLNDSGLIGAAKLALINKEKVNYE